MQKSKIVLIIVIVSFLFIIISDWFYDKYTFQTPILIKLQTPIYKKQADTIFPSPQSHKKAPKRRVKPKEVSNVIERVEASEVQESEAISVIKKYFGKEWRLAVAIATPESGLDCTKRSYQANFDGSYDHGLFQINEVHLSKLSEGESIYDCDVNARIAKEIKDSWQGWHAWSVYNNKSYLQYL